MPHHDILGCPSVTEVLQVIRKPFLERWRGNLGNTKCDKVLKASNELGTKVHLEIQRLFESNKPKTKNQKILTMLSNFDSKFVQSLNVKAISLEPEKPLIDEFNNFHGTYDGIVKINGVVTLADWKTSNQVDNVSWPLQLSAYAHLWNLHNKEQINEGFVVRLDKKTLDIQGPIWYTDLDQYFEVFLSCRRLYDYVNKKGLWSNK